MKKNIVFIVCICLLLSGCMSKEQKEKIKNFWLQQYFNVVLKLASKNAGAWPPGTPFVPMQKAAVPASASQPRTARKPAPQMLEVTLEEETFPGKASYAERVRIKQAWAATQLNNQNTLRDIQTAFGNEVKDKAFYITFNTERKLKQEAATAPNYKAYLAQQKKLLAQQDEAIQQLMEQNKNNLKRVRKMPGTL